MTSMSNEEWKGVQEALVTGGLRSCIDGILASRFSESRLLSLSDANRRIIEKVYADDGDGHCITLVPTDDYPWFAGMYEGSEMMLGLEHNGTLYSIVTLSGGGMVAVIEGRGILDNEMGVAFNGFTEAKAYVQGLIEK
jgi:hypothetical protein